MILVDGHAAAYLRRGERELLLFLPEAEPSRSRVGREVARMLLHLAAIARERRGMLIAEINGMPRPRIRQHGCSSKKGLPRPPWDCRRERNDCARADTDRCRSGAGLHATGIGIAATGDGGGRMAEQRRNISEETLENTRPRDERGQ